MYKHISTLSIAAAMLIGQAQMATATAQNVNVEASKTKGITMVKPSHAVQHKSQTLRKLANGKSLMFDQGLKFKQKKPIVPQVNSNVIDLQAKANPKHKLPRRAAETAALWESFEDYDEEVGYEWLPEGWSRQRTSDDTGIEEAWFVSEEELVPAADEYCYVGINFSSSEKNEWLITPEVTISENQVFSFYVLYTPIFMFNMDDENVDWENLEFINKVKAATMDVRIQVDGGEWTVIKDFFDEYKDMSFAELANIQFSSMTKVTIPLTDYVGKTVRFAFCYSGTDGDSWFVDAVSVDLPQLEANYSLPLNEQYLGFACDADFSCVETSLALFPAYSNITWTNITDDSTASYAWTYDVPDEKQGTVIADTEDELTLKYYPNYDNDEASRETKYATPTLTASASGAADGVFCDVVDMFKVGGKAECTNEEGEYTTYGLLPFDLVTEGISYSITESPDGETSDVPMFGYSDQTKNYWTNYVFNGDAEEGEYAEIEGYVNYIMPQDKPMVVNKVWTNALGRISDDAELKASFYKLSAEGEVPEAPFATATCKGSDVLITEGYSRDYLTVPFSFADPVVLEPSDETSGYLVEISGFNKGGVEYFAPIQSYYPNKDQKSLGWIHQYVYWAGEGLYRWLPLSYYENANGTMYCSFAINLDGYYPWLTADVESLSIGDGETKTIALDSYYDGSELNVTCADGSALPSWLKAEVSGQYNKTVLTLTSSTTGEETQADVLVSAPGVETTISVNKMIGSAINAVNNNNSATPRALYNMNGQRVNSQSVSTGLYLEVDSDGHVNKVVR